MKAGPDWSGHCQIFRKRLGLINQHIGARGCEALVLGHVLPRHARRLTDDEWHRLRGIADVLIEPRTLGATRRVEGKLSAGMEIQALLGNALRRPRIELPPLIRASFKNVRLRKIRILLPFEPITEKRKLDV